jgi:hypothetical protein
MEISDDEGQLEPRTPPSSGRTLVHSKLPAKFPPSTPFGRFSFQGSPQFEHDLITVHGKRIPKAMPHRFPRLLRVPISHKAHLLQISNCEVRHDLDSIACPHSKRRIKVPWLRLPRRT